VTLSSETMMKLMAYADGELEGAERAEVEKLLATDAAAAQMVEQIAGLGGFVKLGHDDRDAQAIAKFDVADAVMAKVESGEKPANVISISAARPAMASSDKKKSNRTKIIGGRWGLRRRRSLPIRLPRLPRATTRQASRSRQSNLRDRR
jgi:anti-sigma factor RsiW